jgi:hypothetical protein
LFARGVVASGRAGAETVRRGDAQEELRAAQARPAEREQALVELKQAFEHAKTTLSEVFKATGMDVLRQAAESLIKQAKDQFDGQHKPSQESLQARQRAIDGAVFTPS